MPANRSRASRNTRPVRTSAVAASTRSRAGAAAVAAGVPCRTIPRSAPAAPARGRRAAPPPPAPAPGRARSGRASGAASRPRCRRSRVPPSRPRAGPSSPGTTASRPPAAGRPRASRRPRARGRARRPARPARRRPLVAEPRRDEIGAAVLVPAVVRARVPVAGGVPGRLGIGERALDVVRDGGDPQRLGRLRVQLHDPVERAVEMAAVRVDGERPVPRLRDPVAHATASRSSRAAIRTASAILT